jgi:hypothetical protein
MSSRRISANARRRWWAGVAIAAIWVPVALPPAMAAPTPWCSSSAGNQWDPQHGVCSATVASELGASTSISVQVPTTLLNDPAAGPIIESYAQHLMNGWRHTGETVPRDNTAGTDYVVYAPSPTVTSVVFHESFQTDGALANNAYRTFTFDLAKGKQLQLEDIFAPGVDPLTALPPLIRPYLISVLDSARPPHLPDTYPFTPDKWEPQPDGSGFSGNYQAFAVTPDELILYMPADPMMHENPVPRGQIVWSMDGGTVVVHVPRSAISSILRSI